MNVANPACLLTPKTAVAEPVIGEAPFKFNVSVSKIVTPLMMKLPLTVKSWLTIASYVSIDEFAKIDFAFTIVSA